MAITGIQKTQHIYVHYNHVPLALIAAAHEGLKVNEQTITINRLFALSALTYSLCTKVKRCPEIYPFQNSHGLYPTSGTTLKSITANSFTKF